MIFIDVVIFFFKYLSCISCVYLVVRNFNFQSTVEIYLFVWQYIKYITGYI